uniref:C2H2-type domain-containing protein n=1 Tax=Sphenodon punctatus TaxID=8508 RepID=A0A8D0G6X7_SPHPU
MRNDQSDDTDENLQNELTKDLLKSAVEENAQCDSLSAQKTSTLSGEVLQNIEEKGEENGTNKRALPESASQDNTKMNMLENEHASKRIKLSVSKHKKECEGKSHTLPAGQETFSEGGSTTDAAIKEVAMSDCPNGDKFLPKSMLIHDSKPAADTTLEAPLQKQHFEEVPNVLSESMSPFQVEEISVSCTVGNIYTVLKCKTCDHIFSTSTDLEKHIQECHLKQSKEHTCPLCCYKSEYSSALQMHIRQTHGQSKLFCCELCGFQSFDENLLHTHFLSKTHIRRKNLAARGGFVRMLTKKSVNKKLHTTVKEKNMRAKPVVNKLWARSTDAKELRNASNKTKDLQVSFSKESDGSELFVEMIPSKSISTEKREAIKEEKVLFLHVEGNSHDQTEKLEITGSSEENLAKPEPTKNVQKIISSIDTTKRLDRSQHIRNILSLKTPFRQSGSCQLKRQIKRRYNLLGIMKRGKPAFNRRHSKHVRPQIKQHDLTPDAPKVLGMEADVTIKYKVAPEIQDPSPDGTNVCYSQTTQFQDTQMKPVADPKLIHTCTFCSHDFQNRKSMEIHVKKHHSKEVQFICQTCGYSCAAKEDFEQHCQSNIHQMGGSRFNCHLCSFISLDDVSFRSHMNEEHNMPHDCATCHLYFLEEKELVVHRTTEQHISLLAQESTSQSIDNEVTVQTGSDTAAESKNSLPKIVYEIEVTMHEETLKPSMVNHGNELKHSVLTKNQFQCKKCFYKTRSSTVLTRHIKLRHAQEYHFLCKACNLYSLSKEGMEKHIKRSKHLENARKNNIGLRFEECIERVCVGASDVKKVIEPSVSGNAMMALEKDDMQALSSTLENKSTNKKLYPPGEITDDCELVLANAPKRGRPKGTISRICPHCGLLASSVTNLTVHIRRKHSHQYSYLCKVCNYYTVTKGDMERHCATKKHKGRMEANGKQNAEIIVCPEGSNIESNSKKINSPVDVLNEQIGDGSQSSVLDASILENQGEDQGNTIEAEAENVVPELEYNKNSVETKQHVFKEANNVTQERDLGFQRRPTGANDNKCAHCEFIAHSSSSLELHVKRKHTKEFEYYCMACDYYAVTCREMTRHAATEKHKMKRQSYVCSSSGEGADTADLCEETAIMHNGEPQHGEEFQTILYETQYASSVVQDTEKVESSPGGCVSDESASSKIPKEGSGHDAVEAETEEESDQGGGDCVCNFQQTPQKEGIRETVSLKEAASCDLQKNGHGQEPDTPKSNCTVEAQCENVPYDMGAQNLNSITNGKSLGENTKNIEKDHVDPEVLAEELQAESTPNLPTLPEGCDVPEQSTFEGDTGSAVQDTCIIEGDKSFKEDSTAEEEQAPMDAQHVAEVTINNVWEADEPTSEGMQETSNEALGTVISTDEKGKTMQNCGQFDSSIVKLKSYQDGESTDHFDHSQMLSGLRIYETTMKVGGSQSSGKKRKPDGNSLGESTRIRCDDCGFLADGLSGLNVHIAMKHPSKEKHFHCLLCGKSFYTESNLHQHLASAGHLRNEQASVEELPEGGATFKCVKCTEPFDSEQNLFLHIKEQHEELLREVNKYIVEDTEQINREREENQGNVCKYCGKMCRSSNSMAFLAHIRTHTGSKPFKCKICYFATAQLGDARNHVKRHLGMREYKCHVCGRIHFESLWEMTLTPTRCPPKEIKSASDALMCLVLSI